jgi:hypothetical protein
MQRVSPPGNTIVVVSFGKDLRSHVWVPGVGETVCVC